MSSNDRHDQLELLLHEAGQARDDDRYMFYQFPTLIAVALALMVAMAALYRIRTERPSHRPTSQTTAPLSCYRLGLRVVHPFSLFVSSVTQSYFDARDPQKLLHPSYRAQNR